jgi:thiamine-monophosphate kinase
VTGPGRLVGDVGETELLRLIEPYLTADSPALLVGPGDDAAVWQPRAGRAVVVTTDSLVEGVHFHPLPGDRVFNADLGWKLLAISLSDLAAMGAQPGPSFLALALAAAWPVADVEALYQGLAECARDHGAGLAGGNLSGATSTVLTSTSLGEIDPAAMLRRQGAASGWQIAVTGRLGGAAAALRVAQADPVEGGGAMAEAEWKRRLRHPEPRLAAGAILLESGVGVCLDVSDGLYIDTAHILGAGLGAVLETARLPAEAGVREAFPHTWTELVGGGEDYELLFAAPPAILAEACGAIRAGGLDATIIGEVDASTGVRLRGPDGGEAPAPPAGHQHFRV